MQSIRLTIIAGFAMLMTGCVSSGNSGNSETPVTAANTAASPTPAAAAPGPRIRECRYAKTTGTKMRYRICHSPEEWAAIDAASAREQNTDDFFRTVGEQAATGAGGVSASPR